MPRNKLPPFDKYFYYLAAVQSPEHDMRLVDRFYREAQPRGTSPTSMREDFCGTFANCCTWVRMGETRRAYGVDLDPEPLDWGREHHLAKLKPTQRDRVVLRRQNVLNADVPRVDAICALNFSYFIFKKRKQLGDYFTACRRGLKPGGVLVLDSFGGPGCADANEERTDFDDPRFSYFWEQRNFYPLTAEAEFQIHFKRPGEPKRKRVFVYDWRIWTIAELKDLLEECGFRAVHTYWEGTTRDGGGDGRFRRTVRGEACEAWISYIVAQA